MGWQEQNNDDGDDDINAKVFMINNLDEFVRQAYLFSIINLRAAMEPEVNAEPDPEKRDVIKEKYIDLISLEGMEPDDTQEVMRIYPLEKCKELIVEKIILNDEKEQCIRVEDLSKSIEETSRNMMYALFGEMQKQGDVELMWDSDKSDFVYGIKKHKTRDEKKMMAKIKRKSTNKKVTKKSIKKPIKRGKKK